MKSLQTRLDAFQRSRAGLFVKKLLDDQAPNLASLLAWGTLSALLPLILGVLSVAGLLLRDPQRVDQVYNTLLLLVPPQAAGPVGSALEGVRTYRPGHFGAWLIGIARNQVALFYRRRKQTVLLDESVPDRRPQAAVEQLVGQRLQLEKVAAALRAIAPDRAEALSLRVLGELPTAEVARLMDRSEPAVRMLIHRAIADLRGRLAEPEEHVR